MELAYGVSLLASFSTLLSLILGISMRYTPDLVLANGFRDTESLRLDIIQLPLSKYSKEPGQRLSLVSNLRSTKLIVLLGELM